MRDPDGYYIEFCNCNSLDEIMEKKERDNEALISSLPTPLLALKMSKVIKEWAEGAKRRRQGRENEEAHESEVYLFFYFDIVFFIGFKGIRRQRG